VSLIIGLDPGSQCTGYGILKLGDSSQLQYRDHGALVPSRALEFAARLHTLYEMLDEVFSRWNPSEVIIEKVFLGRNVDSAFKLGHARGLCLAVASRYRCRIREMAPRAVKKVVTGYGAASKDQVSLAVASWLGMETRGIRHDATDALALAVARGLLLESEDRLNQMMQETP
jgi:crossover junction endodeoxyribonuclease RuvC